MNIIFSRRSIRAFERRELPDSQVELLLRAGMQAPSARNSQPWEFLVINDYKMLNEIALHYSTMKMCAECSIGILVCARPDALPGTSERYFQQDCAAATQNILLEAVDLGLGAVWCGIYSNKDREEGFAKSFNLPAGVVPFSLIAVGYPKGEPQYIDRFKPERVHYNSF